VVVEEMRLPLPAPCDGCGAAALCPASGAPRRAAGHALRALRHADLGAASLAAIHAIAAAFNRPAPPAALQLLVELHALRRGIHALPPLPLEFSLKRAADRLSPALRIVEYSPYAPRGLPSRQVRGPARARALAALAERLAGAPASGAPRWLAAVQGAQSEGLELSFGLDIDLECGGLRPQLYAHVEAAPRAGAEAVLRGVLGFAGVEPAQVARVAALHALGASAGGSDLVLATYSPTPASPRRVKLYFARPLASGHEPSGLRPAVGGALGPFMPAAGLAVLVADSAAVRWEKWDFPCARHPQAARDVAGAFSEGLRPEDSRRVQGILDGEDFMPWTTWLSVGSNASAVYFVPR
jgi:hypothetical protein